jgi:alkylation response protein AidB-like acyl-CoA dehydrogenase
VDFSLTPDQLQIRRATIEFARNELDAHLLDTREGLALDDWKRCAQFGIQALPVPAAFGGSETDALTIAIVLEALGSGCRDNGLLFSLNAHMWSCEIPIVKFGSDEQKRRFLPSLADGSLIGVQAVTEPDAGSDVLSMSTSARKTASGYVLNGSKTFITNAPVAGVFVVFAATNDSPGIDRLSAFVVPRETAGLTVGPPFGKMGLTTSPMSEVLLVDCEVPSASLLGEPGGGLAIFNTSMAWERSLILATAVGVMQRQIEECVAYARDRRQFGVPIGGFQSVSHRIADMKVRLEAARLLLYRQAWSLASGRPSPMAASLVKLFVSEAFIRSSEDAIQTFGAAGYMSGNGVERDLRDAFASRVYSGTSDIQRNIIAAHLGL